MSDDRHRTLVYSPTIEAGSVTFDPSRETIPAYTDAELRRRDALEFAARWADPSMSPAQIVVAARAFLDFIEEASA